MFNGKHRSHELAFLPAALEIMETPPHPLAHGISRTLMALFSFALLWACLGKVNIVASAEGKIIPSSRVKQIQSSEKGVVKNILVKEGDRVSEGQPLVELDRTLTASDQQRFGSELDDARIDLERLQKFQEMLTRPSTIEPHPNPLLNKEREQHPLHVVERAGGEELQSQLLEQQWNQYLAQYAAAKGELAKRRAEQQSNFELIKKLQGTLPLVSKRVNAVKGLMEKKMVPETQYLELEEQRIAQEQDLAIYRANRQQLNAAIEQAEQQLNALVAQTQSDTLAKIADTQQKINALQESLNKAADLNARQILYAPVSGQVQGLAINTVGGVVTEAQQLMMIVPEGENFEVEVYLQNRDIGFVHKGDSAEIKVHTFPFTTYGVINAKVTRISDDAFSIGRETLEQNKRDPGQNEALVYTMGLQMERDTIRVNGKDVRLMPGMAVTAEVLTGERRMIEFFLAPLLKARQESIRER
jgi:hemolysin D